MRTCQVLYVDFTETWQLKTGHLLRAGAEGIEPPIRLLESPGIPFTYAPIVSTNVL